MKLKLGLFVFEIAALGKLLEIKIVTDEEHSIYIFKDGQRGKKILKSLRKKYKLDMFRFLTNYFCMSFAIPHRVAFVNNKKYIIHETGHLLGLYHYKDCFDRYTKGKGDIEKLKKYL